MAFSSLLFVFFFPLSSQEPKDIKKNNDITQTKAAVLTLLKLEADKYSAFWLK